MTTSQHQRGLKVIDLNVKTRQHQTRQKTKEKPFDPHLKQMLWKYENPRFDVARPLCEFVGKAEVDAGGVMREFFHLLMERLKNQGVSINLFEGQVRHLVPIHSYNVLSGGLFVQAGKMILHSIINDCHGVPGLSPAVVSYLMSGKRDAAVAHVCVEDIPDPILAENLTMVC